MKMQELTLENSNLFKGITDGTTTISNVSEKSKDENGNIITKLGGTRLDLDVICGKDNARCIKNDDGSLLLDAEEKVQFDAEGAGMTLAAFMASEEGQKASGATGGIQGMKGTLFGIPYEPGSWQHQLIEAFAGTHDYIGGQVTGLYDDEGNIKRGMSKVEEKIYDSGSAIAIVPAIPFAAAKLLPTDVWLAISIFIKGAR